jgi:NADH-quinone oxidoreductase subunit M
VIFGAITNHHVSELLDLNAREFVILGLLAIGVLAIGIYPAPITNAMQVSVADLLHQVEHSKLPMVH